MTLTGEQARSLPAGFPFWRLAIAAGVAVFANLALAVTASGHPAVTVGIALLPLCVLAFAGLVRQRWPLILLVLILPVTISQAGTQVHVGGHKLSVPDLVVLLALTSWLVARLTRKEEASLRWPTTPVLRWPFALLALTVFIATLRGHYAYGINLLSQPTRLLLFAGIGAALAGADSRRLYTVIVGGLYTAVVWQFANAIYYLATGTSQTGAFDLSTGGVRVLSGTTAAYMASAFFLALLNIGVARHTKRQWLHVGIAILALACVFLAFFRTTFLAVALISPLLVLRRGTLRSLVRIVPLIVPLAGLGLVILLQLRPSLIHTFTSRISLHPHDDLSIEWRRLAYAAVEKQVHESPIFGVGFGKASFLFLPWQSRSSPPEVIYQDPHESYLWLLAGGGIVTLAAFATLIGAYFYDARRRLQSALHPHERILVLWSVSTVSMFLISCFTAPVLTQSSDLLTIWTLLLLPAVVPLRVLAHARGRTGVPRSVWRT